MKDPKYEDVISFGALRQAAKECIKNVKWKSSTQMFMINNLQWCASLHEQLENDTYKSKGFTNFTINERGKIRHIQSVHISERCIQKSLCNNALKPLILPRLIYDNSASVKKKGTSFAIKRIRQHLSDHYKKHGRTGGILVADFSNFFGSIRHDILLEKLRTIITDDKIYNLTKKFIDAFEGNCGLGLGSEICQTCAIFYPNEIDHYIKEHLNIEGYARYMDDFYLIHEDIDYLKQCLDVIERMAIKLGLKLNKKRTKIIRLDQHFDFLKKRFHISMTGKIVMRLIRKNITKRRRTIKKHKRLLVQNRISLDTIRQSYRSWKGYAKKCMVYKSVVNTDDLFNDLFKSFYISRKEFEHYD